MKLTQKLDHFTVFESFPSTIATHRSSRQKNWLVGCARMFSLGRAGVDWREKVTVQNCGRALVKPTNQPGGVVLAP